MTPKSIKRFAVSTALVCSTVLGEVTNMAVPTAHADSCAALLASHLQKAQQTGGTVGVNLVSNEAGRQLVSYTETYLVQGGGAVLATEPTQPGQQLFNQRHHASPPVGPFDAAQPDNLGVSINTDTSVMTLTFLTWGGATTTVSKTQCANGVLYGFQDTPPAPDSNTLTLWTASFFDIPPI